MAKRNIKIVWSRLADLDLDSANSYLNGRTPEAATRFARDILDGVDQHDNIR